MASQYRRPFRDVAGTLYRCRDGGWGGGGWGIESHTVGSLCFQFRCERLAVLFGGEFIFARLCGWMVVTGNGQPNQAKS